MTGMSQRFIGDAGERVRADLAESEVQVVPGVPVAVTVEVTNVDTLIRAYTVEVLGIDAELVEVSEPEVALFPEERRAVTLVITVPDDFPAGRRRVAVHVSDAEGGDAAVMAAFDLLLEARDQVELGVEPEQITAGREASFVVHAANNGNTTLDVALAAQEPEREVEVAFDPTTVQLPPGERRLATALAVGRRPWFGMPVVRVLEFTATGGAASVTRTAVFTQKPRLSRRALAILGLLLVITLFAFVIMLAFGNVADRAEANEELLKQGLGHDGPVGVRSVPAAMQGGVGATTGEPIDGASVELYDPQDPDTAVHSTVTASDGSFRFGSLPDGDYVLNIRAAGFEEVWFPDGATIADAEVLTLGPGDELDAVEVALEGLPGSVSGTVRGAEVEGALVQVRLPADAIEGSELEPAAAEVATIEVDDTGEFLLPDLPTPASYEIAVEKEGFAAEVRTVNLAAGEQREDVHVLLRTGDGFLSGSVVDTEGQPVPNVDIVATDGSSEFATRSLSGDEAAGTFELRDLPTPASFTLSTEAVGYFPESLTVELAEQQQLEDLQLVLRANVGSMAGRVTDQQGEPLGGVGVTVAGGDVERTTVSLSGGEVGSWLATDLPVPGEFTVTFSRAGYASQSLSVELSEGPAADRGGIDAVLTPSTAAIEGIVAEQDGDPIGGVDITLEGAEEERRTRSSDRPAGAYGFAELPAGAYTLTYERAGSRSQTLLVDLDGGERRQLPTVELEPQSQIGGTITVNGLPEAGVGVTVYPLEGYASEVVAETVSESGGTYRVVGLDAPQTYVVEFRVPAGGEVVASETVFLQSGEDLDLDVDL